MTFSPSKSRAGLGLIDYALMAVASAVAVYCAGMSLSQEGLARFLAINAILSTSLSVVFRLAFGNSSIVKLDGILYVGAVLSGFILTPRLNSVLPGEGFSPDVIMAGRLSWMILLGGAFAWRDGTLLFQAIPSVALFGLIGCYDTYPYAVYFFFVFLLCLATLLGRAHGREMLRQAVESGYFNRADAPNTPSEFPEQSPELYDDVRKGPWKWAAGPEWALASALGIVGVSLLGAPAVRAAASPIAAALRIQDTLPKVKRPQQSGDLSATSDVTVGRGPQRALSQRVVYTATLDQVRYLRTSVLSKFTGKGWSEGRKEFFLGDEFKDVLKQRGSLVSGSPILPALEMGNAVRKVSFSIHPEFPTTVIPLPAETIEATGERGGSEVGMVIGGGGTLRPEGQPTINGTLIESTNTPSDSGVIGEFTEFTGTEKIPERVTQFALQASSGKGNSYEQAVAIRRAIGAQCKYNLRAGAVPSDANPAEYFLFDQKEGYCDLFATAMVECARAVGIPSRYVIGFLPEEKYSDGRGHYSIREADYHAWAELYFKGVGWVVFDATGDAEEVPNGERGGTDSKPWYQSELIRQAGIVLFAGGAIGLIFLLLKRKPTGAVPDKRRVELDRSYRRFARLLERASGQKMRSHQTPDEFLTLVEPFLGAQVELARELNLLYVRAYFGPDASLEQRLDEIKPQLSSLAQRLPKSPPKTGAAR